MKFFYTIVIRIYLLSLHLAAIFHQKAKRWVNGRKNWRKHLRHSAKEAQGRARIWMHCASLGEFEQGRPILEHLKAQNPELFILLTFYSPSGYEIRKNYALADVVAYLPGDTPQNARDFLSIINPDLAIFVKYEFWFNLLFEIRNRQIPALLVSARFRPNQPFFQFYGAWFLQQLSAFNLIFLQEAISDDLSARIGVRTVVAGDTRVDRVMQIASENRTFPEIEAFCSGQPVLIAGSTWPRDEAILAQLVENPCFEGWKLIIAPHDVSAKRIESVEVQIPLSSCRHSVLQSGQNNQYARMLVIDHIGMLSAIYRYGTLAYIGGAFGSGLHNILEPVAFRLPVIFGPKYKKFTEAIQLVKTGGALSITNPDELERAFREWSDPDNRKRASVAAFRYVEENQGASARVVDQINQLLTLEGSKKI